MAGKKNEFATFELKMGDTGKEVLDAQKMLAKTGSKIQATSKYTIGMHSAVLAFQKKNKLKATGIIDVHTWNLLMAKTNVVKRTANKKTTMTRKGGSRK